MQILICPDYNLEQPDFFVVAEAGPTLFPDSAPGGPTTLGFIPLMLTQGGVRFRTTGQAKNKQLKIGRPLPPREPV
jgi:hypothetical protein